MDKRDYSNVIPLLPRSRGKFKLPMAVLDGMIVNTANKLGVDKRVIQVVLKTVYKIDRISRLPERDLPDALKFLIEMDKNAASLIPANSSSPS